MIVCERHNFEFHPNFSFSFLETPKIRTFLIFKVESHVCSCHWRHQIKIFDWTQFEYRLYEIASQQESWRRFKVTLIFSYSFFFFLRPSTRRNLLVFGIFLCQIIFSFFFGPSVSSTIEFQHVHFFQLIFLIWLRENIAFKHRNCNNNNK